MTLIEIMVVIAILGMIAAAVAVNVVERYKQAQRQTAMLDLESIESALSLYLVQKGAYPDPAKGLASLKLKSTRDPWGHDYVYRLESGKPVVLSDGAAGGAPIVACPDGCPAGYEATELREETK
jgi:prepilin-type N-terminal cleavage/methylation domain-containing protein